MAGLQEKTFSASREEKIRLNPSATKVTLLHRLAGVVGAAYLHFVGKTSSVYCWDHPAVLGLRREKKSLIYAFWHNTQIFLAYAHRRQGVNVLVSRSKDGEYISQVVGWLGIKTVRGSSTRGGEAALRELCEILKAGGQAAFTPDGPRGPVQSVQGGVVMAAQYSGAPIVPLSYCASRRQVFNSWDKLFLPLPFGRIVVARGKPFTIDKDLPMEQAKEAVRQALNHITDQAEKAAKLAPGWWENLAGFVFEKIYTLLTLVFSPATFLFLLARHGGERTFRFLGERLIVNVPPPASGARRMWFHAASVGEWQALRPILEQLRSSVGSVEFFITVSTPEARELVERENPDVVVRMLPIDLPWVVHRAIDRIRPFAVGIVETEIWPNLITALRKREVPVFLLNGRLSARSSRHWKFVRPFVQRLFGSFSAFFARTEPDARRCVELGAPFTRLQVTGNTKVDNLAVRAPSSDNLADKQRRRHALFGDTDGILIAAASTWGNEEETLLKLYAEKNAGRLRLVLAPRRIQRCDEVKRLLEKTTASWSLWSKIKVSRVWETDILLVDTLGDLKELIAVSDIGFVGGSLVPHGGQNPLEPAAAGIPVLFGPSMENFHEEATELKRVGGARQARHEKDLLLDLRELAGNEVLRNNAGLAAARFVSSKQGASQRVASALIDLLCL